MADAITAQAMTRGLSCWQVHIGDDAVQLWRGMLPDMGTAITS